MTLPRLLVLSLGGTITMTATPTGGIAPTLTAADLLAGVAGLDTIATLEPRSPFRLPSASLTLEQIIAVAADIRTGLEAGFDGAIVIQGTDTIEETAFALDLLVTTHKPVVVVGAMRGPQQPGADGPANLSAAARVAASRQAHGLGTLVVMNDEIHAARYVRKGHTALTSAFVSDVGGPIGLVAEGQVRLFARPARAEVATLAPGPLPPVALVKIGMGDDGRLLRAVPSLGFAAAVIEGAGAGHVPGPCAEDVGTLAAAMPVVLASRTLAGPVFERTYGYAGSEIDLIGRGVVAAGMLPGLKARLLLILALASGWDRTRISEAFRAFD